MAVSKIKQHDMTDCGAACLAAVAAHYRQKLPIARIRQMAGTDKWGTNLLGMIKAAQQMGFEARGVRVDPDELGALPCPAIAHVVVKEGWHHFVVLTRIGKRRISYMDPATGQIRKVDYEQWQKISTGIYLLLNPGVDFSPLDRSLSVWRRFRALIYPHRAVFWQALFGASVYTLLGLSTSIYIQKITDFVLVDGNRNLLNLLSLAMLILIVIQVLIGVSRNLLVLRSGHLIDAELILGYYRHLLHLPQSFFDRMRVGEIISRVGDAVKIRAFINDISINLLVNVQIILCAFALMFTYYWKLALVMIAILPVYAIIYGISDWLNRSKERKVMEKAAELESQLVESLQSVRTIKQLGLEVDAQRRNERKLMQLLEQSYGASLNGIFSGVSSELVNRTFTVILLWVGSRYVLQQALSPGELLSFYALIAYFTGPASSLIGMNKAWQSARIAAERLFEIFDLEMEETGQKVEIERREVGDIRMQGVHFSYTNRGEVLRGVNLNIPKGKMTALVGESGSGKSSIAALLQKLYPLSAGHIYLGDYNLQQISRNSLRRLVGIVPQKIDLFAGTLIENIAPGETDPDLKRIVDLCTRLGLSPFIEQLPQHYESLIGENGVNLSGGQAQRLAIARALYRDPEILILDEATSALDPDTEALVQQFIMELLDTGKTIVLIAHRLSSVVRADQILVLEQGQVVESGQHRDLINRRGRYYDLWQKQLPANWQDILPATGS